MRNMPKLATGTAVSVEGVRDRPFRASLPFIAGAISGMSAVRRSGPVVTGAFIFLGIVVVVAIFAPLLTPFDPTYADIVLRNRPPLTAAPGYAIPHLLGTDPIGRDELSRLIFAARVSVVVATLSVLLSGSVGLVLGLLAGYFKGWVDSVIMRLVDLQMALPGLLAALLVIYIFGPSVLNVILVIAAVRWMIYARVTRGLVLAAREQLFVSAAVALGCSHIRIMRKHLIPHFVQPIIILATLEMALVLLLEASLDFLGLGVQPPAVSWGLMVSSGQPYITSAWWLSVWPGFAILLTALSLNLVANWAGSRNAASALSNQQVDRGLTDR